MKTNLLKILSSKSIATILVAGMCMCNSHAMFRCSPSGSASSTPTMSFLPAPSSVEEMDEETTALKERFTEIKCNIEKISKIPFDEISYDSYTEKHLPKNMYSLVDAPYDEFYKLYDKADQIRNIWKNILKQQNLLEEILSFSGNAPEAFEQLKSYEKALDELSVDIKEVYTKIYRELLKAQASVEAKEEVIPTRFEDLPNPCDCHINPNYDDNRDRYPNIHSIKQIDDTAEPNQIMPEYLTKNGRMINATKIIKTPDFSLIATQAPIQSSFDNYLDLLFSSDETDGIVVLGPVTDSNTTWERRGIPPYFIPNSPITLAHNENSFFSYTCESINADETLPEKIDGVHKYTLKIKSKKTGEEKIIPLYHFSAWPDKDVPTNTEDFKKFVNMFIGNRDLVVHCSAGIGRTGVFSSYLYSLKTGERNPFKIVYGLRQYRTGMVQTKEQFELLQDLLK